MINVDAELPKISCLLVTAAGRIDHFRRSCQCYFDQTYPNRELVVVNEGPREYQEQIRDFLAERDDVNFVFLNGRYSLGSLRNISIAMARGELFVQWDDDDFNTPERIALQYWRLLRDSTARVSYFADQLHYYFPTKTLYWEHWSKFHSGGVKKYSLIPGTIMAYKKGFWGRYPAGGHFCSAGEDSILAQLLLDDEDRILISEGYGYCQVYSYHGSNVWGLDHHMKISRERALETAHMIANRTRICQTIDYLGLEGPIQVMGREGLAFTYGGEVD